jgi:hypothetical protein
MNNANPTTANSRDTYNIEHNTENYKDEQIRPHQKPGWNSGAREE